MMETPILQLGHIDSGFLILPVSFILLDSFIMRHSTFVMDVWVRCFDIINTILPDVNRLWSPAGVRFKLIACKCYTFAPTVPQKEALNVLENSNRRLEQSDSKLNSVRLSAIQTISSGLGVSREDSINIFLLPYMGQTRQGNTHGTNVVCGTWSDKPSRGQLPPSKVLLTEPGDFVQGSLSRTIAHEIGHVLGLRHPINSSIPRLMGGDINGNLLTEKEIEISRRRAKHYLRLFAEVQNYSLNLNKVLYL